MGSVGGFNGIILKQLSFFQLSIIRSMRITQCEEFNSIIPDKLYLTFPDHIVSFIGCQSGGAPISPRSQISPSYMYKHFRGNMKYPQWWSCDPHSWWIHTHICHTNEWNTRTPSNNKKSVTCQTPLLVVFRYISFSNNWSQGILAIMPSCIVRRSLFFLLFFFFENVSQCNRM